MKVDRGNWQHWVLLLISAVNIFISIPFRLFYRKKGRVIFFYQMHGNSKALVDYIESKDDDIEMYLLAFPEYLRIYDGRHNLPTLNMLSLRDMIKVAQSDVVITNYSALTLMYYAKFTDLKFVDVWHGLPMLKNQTPKIMNYLNYYAEVWVSSEAMKRFYKTRYKLRSKIIPTGYGRTDRLFNNSYEDEIVRHKYGLPDKKIILIAPTWKHNNPDRSIYPFGMNGVDFLNSLNRLAEKTSSHIVFRAHMLSTDGSSIGTLENIQALSSREYPDTEELLSVADMVITDWSSLVYDFLATKKPIIFLEGQPPFTGKELRTRSNPNNRFGPIVESFAALEIAVIKYLANPTKYQKTYAKQIKNIEDIAYGDLLDGQATQRYYNRLKGLLGKYGTNR